VFSGDNPVVMIDPNGEDWFYYQAKNEKSKSWHHHKGNTATYIDTKGNEVTTNKGYEYLVTFKVTGKNSEGSSTGTVTVYKQDKVEMTVKAFTGNDNYKDMAPMPSGNYMMDLDRRDANGPQKIKADGSNPEPFVGIQAIPDNATFTYKGGTFPMTPTVTGPNGNGRIRLNQTDGDLNMVPMNQQPAGYYLHGKKQSHNYTHGCVCDKTERVFNYFWSGAGKNVRGQVPFSVTR
jgi:hypothetical protein